MSTNGHHQAEGSGKRDNVPKKVLINILESDLKRIEKVAKRLKTALTVIYYERALGARADMPDQEEAQREALDEAMDKAQKVELGE